MDIFRPLWDILKPLIICQNVDRGFSIMGVSNGSDVVHKLHRRELSFNLSIEPYFRLFVRDWITCMFSYNYNDVIMSTMASQITSLTIVYPTAYSGANQRKHQSSASLAFVRGIHRWPHKLPVTWKMFPYDDVIMGPREDSSARMLETDGFE